MIVDIVVGRGDILTGGYLPYCTTPKKNDAHDIDFTPHLH